MGVMRSVVLIWTKIIIMRGETTGDTMELFLHHRLQLLHLVVVGFLPAGVGDNAKGRESGVRLYKVGRKGSQGQGQDHRAARLHLRSFLQMYPRHLLPPHQTDRPQEEGKEVLLLRQRLLLRPAYRLMICSPLLHNVVVL